ncbi:MAG: RsmB/NOP family class I SAM-dependent RNA methyltransferase [Alphaproteobacteria bacterium]|nr:RsmB/NOP family class I SAM-dependent RNA methyltransferase [Alphaproteobacteria bacterium]
MQNPRIISAKILQSVLEDKVFFSDLKQNIEEENRAFVNMLVLSTLRNLIPLQKTLANFLKKKIAHKNRIAEYLLLLAIEELFEMNTPVYAVLDSTVKNIRSQGSVFLANMANAVLRNICRNMDQVKSDFAKMGKLPTSFKMLLQGYNKEQIQAVGHCINEINFVDLSVKDQPEEWAKRLNALLLPNGSLRLTTKQKISELDGYDKGSWWVQDVAASLPAMLAGDLSGKTVADLCAAPGGKTAQLALSAEKVYAFDISASRLERLKENMFRLDLADKVEVINADAADYLRENTKLEFDVILLDAPCSATGTFRRHPEVLHIKNIDDVNAQKEAQKTLLKAATASLKKGGILVYSVCSIAKAEGEEQIQNFLAQNPNFKIIPITEADVSIFGAWSDNFILEDGTIRTLPYYAKNIGGMDAFFICKLQKIN